MGTWEELHGFLRQNKDAWQLASKACDDYLLARLGMLNALWSGFEMATQATEKLLKAYLLLTDKTFSGKAKKAQRAVSDKAKSMGRSQEWGHDVQACLELATGTGLQPSVDLRTRLARINSYYGRRYPDSGGPTSISAAEVHDVDEALFEIWDAFRAVNDDYYHVGGLMSPIYSFWLQHRSQAGSVHHLLSNNHNIMVVGNRPLADRRVDLQEGILHRLNVWSPKSSPP